MINNDQDTVKNNDIADDKEKIPKVSKITFDEKTGTITLKLASEEEIQESKKSSS